MLKRFAISEKNNKMFGLILTYVSMAISLFASFFITPIVLNGVGDREYGLLAFCNSITTWLSLVSNALGASYIYFATKEAKKDGTETKTNSLFLKMLIIISFFVLLLVVSSVCVLKFSGFQFSNYTSKENDLIFILLLVSGLNVVSSILFSLFGLYNSYKKNFVFIKSVAIIASILTYLINLLIALTAKSIILIAVFACVLTVVQGIANLIFAIKARKMIFSREKTNDSKEEIREIFRYSSIILVGVVISNLDSNLDKTLLGIMANAESVTYYQLSITFNTQLTLLSWGIIDVMRPTIYNLYRNGKEEEANSLFLKISKFQSIIILFIIGGFLSCGYDFTLVWIGDERISVFYFSSVLFVARIVPLSLMTISEVYRAKNMHRIPTTISIIAISINLILSILFLLVWDIKYAVWACIIGTIVPTFVFSWLVNPIIANKKLNLPTGKYYIGLLKNILIMIAACFPAIVVTRFFMTIDLSNFLKMLIEGAIFVFIYSIGILLFERKIISYVLRNYIFQKKDDINEGNQ